METEKDNKIKSDAQGPLSDNVTAGPEETTAQEQQNQNHPREADHAECEIKVEVADIVETQPSKEIQYVYVEYADHVEAIPHIGAEIDAESVSMEVAGDELVISTQLMRERNNEDFNSSEEEQIEAAIAEQRLIENVDSAFDVKPIILLKDTAEQVFEKTSEGMSVGLTPSKDVSNSVPVASNNSLNSGTLPQAGTATNDTPSGCLEMNATGQSSLGLLSQYLSDSDANEISDTDSVVVVSAAGNNKYRNKVVEIDSDSDSSSSESSDSDIEYLTRIRKEMDKRFQKHDDGDDDMDGDEDDQAHPRKRQPPKVKGEMLLEDLPPIQDLHITVPEEECVELGRVHSIVEQLVLVNVLPESVLLNLETVLFLDKGRKVLGEVFDVLGQVVDPLYCVRFNSNKQIHEKNIKVGDIVYVAPKTEYTQFVILSSLQVPGSDASWKDDVEPPPRYLDYSDDEEEREARRQLRRKKRAYANEEGEDTSTSTSANTTESFKATEGPRRGRRDNFGGAAGDCHVRNPSHSPSPHGYRSNYNRGSWHSNYGPPHPGGMMRSSYPMPHPGPPHMHRYPTLPPMGAYTGTHFGPPMSFRQGPPFPGSMCQPTMGPPPMFGLNPYTIPPPPLPDRRGQQHVIPPYPPGTE